MGHYQSSRSLSHSRKYRWSHGYAVLCVVWLKIISFRGHKVRGGSLNPAMQTALVYLFIADKTSCHVICHTSMTDERNFRTYYYEKFGISGVEEKKSIEILLKEQPLCVEKIRQFCLRFPVPSVYRSYLWKVVLGKLILSAAIINVWKYALIIIYLLLVKLEGGYIGFFSFCQSVCLSTHLFIYFLCMSSF